MTNKRPIPGHLGLVRLRHIQAMALQPALLDALVAGVDAQPVAVPLPVRPRLRLGVPVRQWRG